MADGPPGLQAGPVLRLKGAELPVLRKYLVLDQSAGTGNLSAWWPIRGHSACPHGKHRPCEDSKASC